MLRIPATTKTNQYTVIFLHGLGDSGNGWSFLSTEAKNYKDKDLSNINFIFPTAPKKAITINFGIQLNAWYDIKSLDDVYLNEDKETIFESAETIRHILINENVKNKIPFENIILGGFSQGCALSLLILSLIDFKIGGIIGLSGYFPVIDEFKSDIWTQNPINKNVPIFIGHGTNDNAIKFNYSLQTLEFLTNDLQFENVTYKEYKGLAHSVSTEETSDILSWIGDITCQ